MKELVQPEVLHRIPELIFLWSTLAAAIGMALSKAQREKVRERDDNRCQGQAAGIKHRCNEKKGVQVHHILSGMYLTKLEIDPDENANNLLTICQNLHNMIHPILIETYKNYHPLKAQGRDSFKEMVKTMKEQIDNGELNWNPEYDRRLQAIAMKRTQQARKKGWRYPLTRKQQKKYGVEEL